MEANEAQELQEHAEHAGHSDSLRPVALTMTILAVLVAVVTVLGHRTHTDAILNQTKAAVEQNLASDEWAYYQAKKTNSNEIELNDNLLGVLALADKAAAEKLEKKHAERQQKLATDLKEGEEKAREHEKSVHEFEQKVEEAEHKANYFDFGEALLEIGLVISSVTLLTKSRIYWYLGLGFSAIGIVATVMGLLLK